MKIDLTFKENDQMFCLEFGQLQNLSDGGYEKGYAAGYDAGYAKGYADGETVGYAQGEAHGRTVGYEQGKTDGHADGYAKGYADGYAAGYEAGQEVGYNKGHAEGYTEGETVGREIGYADGREAGYVEGKKAEYDAFWDSYLNPTGYAVWAYRFAGIGWNDRTFNPPADIVPINSASMMFASCGVTDLEASCKKYGISIDFSKVTSFSQIFTDSYITHVGVIDTRSASNMNNIFFNAIKMVTVDKIILKQDGSQTINSGFNNARELQNITFEGVIGNSISFIHSPLLTDASVQSIIDHLKDLTGATAQTLTLHATVGGKLTPEQKAAITAKNWTLVY